MKLKQLTPARFDWHHTPATDCHMLDFARQVQQEPIDSYEQLHHWSVTEREAFWQACMEQTGVITQQRGSQVLNRGEQIWQDQWFADTTLNYAENLLRFRDTHTALIFCDELGHRQRISYHQLRQQVARLSVWLQEQGVQTGDRVAGFTANRIETVIAMLASTALGAVWTSCSPDFGFNGVIDRFSQTEPVILFAVSSHCYAGKIHQHQENLKKLCLQLPSVRHLVLLPEIYQQEKVTIDAACAVTEWTQALTRPAGSIAFKAVPFNHPLFIMYSSGTTGAPKCITHGHGGTLLQHRKEHHLHLNLKREDVLFYFTTCGWMMWNWLISGLASGATLVLYDGSPFHPQPSILFDLADSLGISIFGTSARYLASAEQAKLNPLRSHRLSRLHTVLSTGSPLSESSFDYVHQQISPTAAIQSMSGGTDILSCFVLGCPLLPVYRGQIQCAGLGMDVAVFNDSGKQVIEEQGELVCRQSFPSMPVGFWNDDQQRKYRAAYFERFPNFWCQGDLAEQSDSGSWVIHGRSDTVLNPGGVRIGTAELYRQLEGLYPVRDAVAVGQQWQGDVRIVLFVQLADNVPLDDLLIARIKQAIRQGASPRHVPALICQVKNIPRTLNGKLAEVAVRDTIHGKTVANKAALLNPEALTEYENLV
ncbi:acetoacetate--CoA ligase [Pseudohongiella spirulinae]|uniref:Acetoacetyl-CoA synthetase n=1 Tax=Pseudohongiella spirulinae TaxID=1249552 RepID=A0A0S2KDJ7_9GAMM|nr:acetoacetate--CoA ligase [Pseudohongiella spirulinae]ALO46384.1 Acetoacetyl-CoA synthetase [Pseudohongiella spirulinae]